MNIGEPPNGNLERLKVLAQEAWPSLPTMIDSRKGNMIEYSVINGTCFGKGLLEKKLVSVQDAFMSKGTIFPEHTHSQVEIIIVYKGALNTCVLNEPVQVIRSGEVVVYQPGTAHAVEAIEDTWMVAVTVPADEGYPNAR